MEWTCFSRSLLTSERREMGRKLEGDEEGGEHLGIVRERVPEFDEGGEE